MKKTSQRGYMFNPQVGGKKISPEVQVRVQARILAFAQKHYHGKYIRLDIRFHGQFCYIDAFKEPQVMPGWPPKDWGETSEEFAERLRNTAIHLCRLRYFGQEDAWSFAFYAYSDDAYKPCIYPQSSSWMGTPEQAFDASAGYLHD